MAAEAPSIVQMGSGEYLVFREDRKPLDWATFIKSFDAIQHNSPSGVVQREKDPKRIEALCKDRFRIIQEQVQRIDPSLRIAFVPRTSYELGYLEAAIQEDVDARAVCPSIRNLMNKRRAYQQEEIENTRAECWHTCSFEFPMKRKERKLFELAFRLNERLVKQWNPQGCFTREEIFKITEEEIAFLQNHFKTFKAIERSFEPKREFACQRWNEGPAVSFGLKSVGKSMVVKDEATANIIREAVKIEMSELGQSSFLFYRGAELERDSPVRNIHHTFGGDGDCPFSLSLGDGLFSGAPYDAGATAFCSFLEAKQGYVQPVKFEELLSSPFYKPLEPPLRGMLGYKELFHGRTIAWRGAVAMNGIQAALVPGSHAHLFSSMTREELIASYNKHKQNAFYIYKA